MTGILVWPHKVLVPGNTKPNIVPFTRSGGRSLGGLEPKTRTDRGWWSITLENVMLNTPAKRRTWNAISTALSGGAGLIAVPAWSFESAPHADGEDWRGRPIRVTHSDGSTFSDGSKYRQRRISVKAADAVPISATSIRLQIINAANDLSGVRFSYQYGLYKTGPATLIDGNFWTVPITPAVRYPIPAGAELEFDMPMCLCHLADDRGMDSSLSPSEVDAASVGFVEASEFWSQLALGLIDSPFLA